MGAAAQPVPASTEKTLKAITITEKAEAPEGRDAYRATTSGIGKGNQALRDIPQSITVVTERLIDDRNLDTLKDVLHNTAGVTFQAAEGGEEDIRLRGFSLAATGDIFVDGMRDPAFYERDTFASDRVELLRGSASMLFGRGSTGGAVNQVSKQPRTMDESEVTLTAGSYNYRRATGDFNIQTGENAALRLDAMVTKADNNGAGTRIDKKGMAAGYRFGIGTTDEFLVNLFSLKNDNGINYGIPWIKTSSTASVATTTLINRLDPSAYFGLASDSNAGSADSLTLGHTHRFEDGAELKTLLRKGIYTRDQRAGAIRLVSSTAALDNFSDATAFRRGNNNKIQDMATLYAQSDYSQKVSACGVQHAVLAGVDAANEKFRNYNNYNDAFPTGVLLIKPDTRAGTPNDGASVNEAARVLAVGRTFEANALGLYAQDMVQLSPEWKVLGGLRFDNFSGTYWSDKTRSGTGAITADALSRSRSDALWSKRLGVLYQPSTLSSFHFSYGTSFNTSGDTYQYDNQSVNTPAEGSENIEVGAKLDLADKRFTTRLALFQSTKTNERNRDPDSAATQALLSGRRHSAGIEVDATGRLTPALEIYGSYAWTPIATIDVGAPGSIDGVAEGAGTRASLTPVHSGTVWATYQLNAQWRVGGGLNLRSEQTPNRNPGWAAPGFVTADLMAEYTASERATVKLNATNITNVLYADSLYTGHYVPGTGRTAQITLNLKF
jgi:catecholate siderophore receptor